MRTRQPPASAQWPGLPGVVVLEFPGSRAASNPGASCSCLRGTGQPYRDLCPDLVGTYVMTSTGRSPIVAGRRGAGPGLDLDHNLANRTVRTVMKNETASTANAVHGVGFGHRLGLAGRGGSSGDHRMRRSAGRAGSPPRRARCVLGPVGVPGPRRLWLTWAFYAAGVIFVEEAAKHGALPAPGKGQRLGDRVRASGAGGCDEVAGRYSGPRSGLGRAADGVRPRSASGRRPRSGQ
jgi:hypothetical protein